MGGATGLKAKDVWIKRQRRMRKTDTGTEKDKEGYHVKKKN